MTVQSQKEAVYQATCAILDEENIQLDGRAVKEVATPKVKTTVVMLVTQAILGGAVQFSPEAQAKHCTEEAVRKYVNGMVDNWWRKDTRLNGGSKYETKNPGARAGQGDAMLKNLKAMHSLLTSQGQVEGAKLVAEEIEKRTAELAAAKAKTVAIDPKSIPEHLRHLLGQ